MEKIVAEICKLFGKVVTDAETTTRLALLVCLVILGWVLFKLA